MTSLVNSNPFHNTKENEARKILVALQLYGEVEVDDAGEDLILTPLDQANSVPEKLRQKMREFNYYLKNLIQDRPEIEVEAILDGPDEYLGSEKIRKLANCIRKVREFGTIKKKAHYLGGLEIEFRPFIEATEIPENLKKLCAENKNLVANLLESELEGLIDNLNPKYGTALEMLDRYRFLGGAVWLESKNGFENKFDSSLLDNLPDCLVDELIDLDQELYFHKEKIIGILSEEKEKLSGFGNGEEIFNKLILSKINDKKAPRYLASAPFDRMNFQPGRLIFLGGDTGIGKSAALLQIATSLIENNANLAVVYASVELNPSDLMKRIISSSTQITLDLINNGSLTAIQKQQLNQFDSRFFSRMDFLNLEDSRYLNRIENRVLEILGEKKEGIIDSKTTNIFGKRSSQFQPNGLVLCLDYLQEIKSSEGDEEPAGEEHLKIITIARKLRELANRHNICIVSVCAMTGEEFNRAKQIRFHSTGTYSMQKGDDGITVFHHQKSTFDKHESFSARFVGEIQTYFPIEGLEPLPAQKLSRKGGRNPS